MFGTLSLIAATSSQSPLGGDHEGARPPRRYMVSVDNTLTWPPLVYDGKWAQPQDSRLGIYEKDNFDFKPE